MKLLITGSWKDAQDHITEIESMGHEVVFMQWENSELPCLPDEIEGIICNGLFLHHPIEAFVNLKYIQLTSAGFDRVPMDYVRSHNIHIHNARGVYSIPMAEFTVCGVLQLYKQSRFFLHNQKQHKWEKHRGLLELYGKTVCIVGCGSVGTEVARRFKAFGCRITGIDLYAREDENFIQKAGLKCLDAVLHSADIIVLTVPLTEQTRYLIDKRRLSFMKPNAVLVNIARGAVVETDALIEALWEEKLCGAVLDVYEDEPLREESPLWDMEQVICTPHCSFVGDGNESRIYEIIIENIKQYCGG